MADSNTPVSKEARDQAADYFISQHGVGRDGRWLTEMRNGRCDDHPLVQAFQRAIDQSALTEREAIARWLEDGDDQACEDLCDAIFAENRKQRAENVHVGQPYFQMFADAIRERQS